MHRLTAIRAVQSLCGEPYDFYFDAKFDDGEIVQTTFYSVMAKGADQYDIDRAVSHPGEWIRLGDGIKHTLRIGF